MPEAQHRIGDSFRVHFAWKIPGGDFVRALFDAEVLGVDELSAKYVLRLTRFVAGRQETSEGETRPSEELDRNYWWLVGQLEGRKVALAFEAEDGRPLWLRLETLTGEHNFFRRLNELPPAVAKKLENR
jgi:hypothetical protein